MIYPEFIKKGDTIGVTAPSDGITNPPKVNRLNNAIKSFQEKGYNIIETKNVRTSIKGESAEAKVRAEELEKLYKNKDVKLIVCASGGDFLIEMLSYTNFAIIKDNIKWLQGYSDPTGLLFTITTNYDIATIYGSNFCAFGMSPWDKSLVDNLETLEGKKLIHESYEKYEKSIDEVTGLEPYNLVEDVKWENLSGENKIEIKGRLIGGCLDIISELFGTRFDKTKDFIEKYKEDGIIWYFDNCELTSEGLIRTLWRFKDNGYFKYTKGIVFGRSATESSYYDISFKEALLHSLGDLNIPIIINADVGHIAPRITFINGAHTTITSENAKGKIEFELK